MWARTLLMVAVAILAFSSVDLFGDDSGGVFVADSDLQHHRWVLESVNGEALPTDAADGMIPELDFGEQRHVEGNSGCNRFSGRAILRDGYFFIEAMASTGRLCTAEQNELEHAVLNVLHQESMISLDENRNLTLEAGGVVLSFKHRDWVG